ncbi:MAG: OmpA family protein [Candidatus Marinimicrobia bacterium]|nr:OmpA family protein [Candidatus Neomarinimicrobiota bacterium]MCK9559063.1 OmpA family protein [Candidatus Neomarinimicrobiota bacterium]
MKISRVKTIGILWILMASLRLLAQTPVGTEIENVAFGEYHDAGGYVYSIQSQPVITTVSQGYILTISKSVETTTFLPSDTVEYYITLINSGNLGASSITVTDTLSSDLIYVSSQPPATVSGQIISWNLIEIQPGATSEINLTAVIAPSVSSGATIENSAGFRTPENVTGESAGVEITIGFLPDLALQKTVDRQNAAVGDTLIYTLTLQNVGNAPTTHTILYDDIPDQTEFITCSGAGQNILGLIGWNIGEMSPGTTVTETITTVVRSGTVPGTTITNTASVTNSENISPSAYASTLVIEEVRHPDLQIEKTAGAVVEAGQELTYNIAFQNSGDGSASDVIITDTLSANVDYVSSSGSSAYDSQTRIVTWDIGTLTANMTTSQSVELTVQVKSPLNNGTVITNTAEIACSEGFSAKSVVSTTVESAPVLTITNTVNGEKSPGDTLTYRLVFGNTGNTVATGIVVTDSLGAEVEFISATGLYQYESADRRITWNRSDSNSGTRDSVEVNVRVRSGILDGSVVQNNAKVVCAEGESATASAAVTIKSPVLVITKTPASTVVPAGEELKYKIRYRNTGSGIATNVVITDTLSADLDFLASTGSSSYDSQTRIVTWDIGTLNFAMSSSDSLELTVKVKPLLNNGTVIANMAEMACAEGLSAKSSVNITVKSAPILSLTKTTRSKAYAGEVLAYNLEFANSGNAIATQTVVADTLSPLVEFVDASGIYTFDDTKRIVRWEIGNLFPDADSSLSFNARVKADLVGSFDLVNTAWIRSQESAEDSDSANTRVTSLSMRISANPDSLLGNGATYSDISAMLTDAGGQPANDGMKVVFSTSHGSFASGIDTALTINGTVQTRLLSSRINQATVPVKVKARLVDTPIVSDSADVVFYAATIVGTVTDADKNPVADAVVILMYAGAVVGTDTTTATGQYEFAIFESGTYTIIIQITDDEGNTRNIEQTVEIIVSESGQISTIGERSSISGRLIDSNTQMPIREANIPVIISAILPSPLAKSAQTALSDTTVTDSMGFWTFSNLEPATYSIKIEYNSIYGYDGGQCIIVLDAPGQYVIDADIVLRPIPLRIYKTVDKPQVLTGDTLTYRIYYESLEYAVVDTFQIADQLPPELEWISGELTHSAELIADGFDIISNELRFYRHGMSANLTDSVVIKAKVKTDLAPGLVTITNQASIFSPSDTLNTTDDPRTNATTRIISPFLAVKKAVNRRVVETGDVLTYTVTLENRSSDLAVSNLVITDILPHGFRYREKRSVWNGRTIADPFSTIPDACQTLIWTMPDTLLPGKSGELRYRVIIGLDSRLGENENSVSATAALPDGLVVPSNTARAEVILKPGMIQERGFIFGKVFFDLNDNNLHDQDEAPVKGVEIITQEGIRVITDQYGKYSIPNVRSGDHVLRINPKTLPDSSVVKLSSSDFLGDSTSRLVKIRPGGIAKANFILESTSLRPEAVTVTLTHPKAQTDTASLDIEQKSITKSFRILAFKPWSMTLNLGFQSGNAILLEQDQRILNQFVDFLKWQTHLSVEINGYADDQVLPAGSRFKDIAELSLARANAVMNYLKQQGIEAERIKTNGLATSGLPGLNPAERGHPNNIEMIFRSSQEYWTSREGIRFQTDFRHSGNLPLKKVRLVQNLPKGFVIGKSGNTYDNVAINAEKSGAQSIRWNLGSWEIPAHHILNYSLVPTDYHLIQTGGSARSIFKFETPDGETHQTRILKNRIETRIEEAYFRIVLEGTSFDFSSAHLKPRAKKALSKIGEFLIWQKQMTITVEGFTDTVGTESRNQRLSEKRANAVKDYLVKTYLIDPDRIITKGLGEHFPIADCSTAEGRALNRRVEVMVNADLVQKTSMDMVIHSDTLHHHLEKTTTYCDSLSGNGKLIPGSVVHPRAVIHFASQPLGKFVRITAQLSEGLFFPNLGSDSLQRFQTWTLPVNPGQQNFEVRMEIGSESTIQDDQSIHFRIESLNERTKTKGLAEQTITVRIKRS